MNNESKCFGLFGLDGGGGDDHHQSKEAGEIIDDDDDEPSMIPDSMPTHGTLTENFVAELDLKQKRKNQKHCSTCHVNPCKYTCPRCGIKTCSAKCSNQHKKEFECSGIRDQFAFVPLKHYSENDFNSDYNFLEKGGEIIKDSDRILKNNPKKDLSNWTIRFMQECQKRRINYKKMPLVFQRAKSNRSIFLYKEKSIYWDIEFIFPYCKLLKPEHQLHQPTNEDESNHSMNDDEYKSVRFKRNRICENRKLSDIIKEIFDSKQWINDLEDGKFEVEHVDFSPYKNSELMMVLLKCDSGDQYKPLVQEWSIRRNLEDQNIIEFPTIVVILKCFATNYSIVEKIK